MKSRRRTTITTRRRKVGSGTFRDMSSSFFKSLYEMKRQFQKATDKEFKTVPGKPPVCCLDDV